MTKTKVPAVEGWFTLDPDEPHLLGSRCTECGTVFFPAERTACRNPGCTSLDFEEHRLARRGRVWSFSRNHYAPPAPYVAPDPFVPYTVAAVEIPDDKVVVLGQVAGATGGAPAVGGGEAGVDASEADGLKVGQEVELVLDTLYEDDDHEYLVWKWRPVADGSTGAAGATGGAGPAGGV